MKAYYLGPSQESPEAIIDKLLHPPTSLVAIDCETVSLEDRTMLGFGVATSPQDAYYIPVWPERSEILEQVYRAIIANPAITKLGHNYNFDLSVFRQFAVANNLPYPDTGNLHDTGIVANVSGLDADVHTLAYKYTNVPFKLFTIQDLFTEAKELTGKRSVNMMNVDPAKITLKCQNDVRTTYALFEPLMRQLTPRTLDCYQVDRELLGVLKTIEQKGLKLNERRVEQRYRELADKLETYEEWADENGFKISSPAQVGMFLGYNNIVLPTTKSGRQLATSEEILRKFITHPTKGHLVRTILEYRELAKIFSTYVSPARGKSRVYTHFRLDLATGRLASGGENCPDHYCTNLQNVPPDLRDIYEPDNGVFTWADMSQLEMRVFAYLSQDKTLLDAYRNGQSIHNVTFKALYPQLERTVVNERGERVDSPYYTKAKTANFAMIFDAQDGTIADQCEVTIAEAKRFKETWFSLYHGGKTWMDSKQNTNSEYEETIFGRRMRIPQDWERSKGHANKCRINYPVQGSGADLNKRGLLQLWKKYSPDVRLQVHDEIVVDGKFDFPAKELEQLHPEIYVPWEVKEGAVWV